MKKNQLILERTQLSKINELHYLAPSDCKQQKTHWDLILSKYLIEGYLIKK